MAICATCGKALQCAEHGPPLFQNLGLVQECPKKAAVWVHVKDDSRANVAGIDVSCAGKTVTTGSDGYAFFDDLDPSSYTAAISVPAPGPDQPRKYRAPEVTSKDGAVGAGEVKLFRFELKQLAHLRIKVVRADDESKFVPDILIDVQEEGKQKSLPQKTSDNSQRLSHESIDIGNYKVTLSFPSDEIKAKYRDPGDQAVRKLTLKGGDDTELVFKLTPVVRLYFTLKFNDPDAPGDDGRARFFPEKLPLVVVSSGENKVEAVVGADGAVRAKDHPAEKPYVEVPRAWQWVTLELPTDKKRWVVCEKRLDAAVPAEMIEEDDPYKEAQTPLSVKLGKGKRVFRLPAGGKWNLKNADWKVKQGEAAPGNYKDDEGKFEQLESEGTQVGSAGSRVLLLLDMHWQYLRFDYYDRFYGEEKWSKKPISILPLLLEGYAKQQKDNDTPKAEELTTIACWTIGPKDIELVQCLPWIIRRKDDDSELKKPDKDSTLRFQTSKERRFIKSDAFSRVFARADKDKPHAPEGAVKVSVDRLRYYDLPEEWRSTGYHCRLSDAAADQDFFEMMVEKATAKDKPLIFSLDDMVLTDENLQPVTWRYENPEDNAHPNDRVAIFFHKFSGPASWDAGKSAPALLPKDKRETWVPPKPQPRTARGSEGLSPDGVYLHESASHHSYQSAVCMPANYIADYPDWTRMVLAQGNVHDVFDRRTLVKDRTDKAQPVGARAAVRWVESATASNAAGQELASRPAMKKHPSGGGDPDEGLLFATQPLFGQEHFAKFQKIDGTNAWDTGRCDPVLLRCCDREDKTEIGQVLVYGRVAYDFAVAPANGLANDEYANKQSRNVADRWNGRDGNGARTELLPKDGKTALKLKVAYFNQVVPKARAHLQFKLVAGDGRSWVFTLKGTGELNHKDYQAGNIAGFGGDGFVACHEWGHFTTQPDDYGERWNYPSYDQLDYSHHVCALPFEDDDPALMKSNRTLRGRNFWFLAEWVRKALGVEFKLKHGGDEKFSLPKHPSAPIRTYASWPLATAADATLGGRSKFDVALYALGEDKTANDYYPGLYGSGSAFDGVAVVMLRLQFKFWTSTDGHIRYLLAEVDKELRQRMNNKFYAVGKVSAGVEQVQFKRCMILFQPRYLVETFSGGAHWKNDDGSPMSATDFGDKLNCLRSWCGGPHLTIDMRDPPAAPPPPAPAPAAPTDRWSGLPGNVWVHFLSGATLGAAAGALSSSIWSPLREALGLPAGNAELEPANLAPVIKKVIPDASVWKKT